jgi:glycosyltransferase involved in cell wall biosynthesis
MGAGAEEHEAMIVSVVTPLLNGGDYLRACIESVKAQTPCGIHVEHVVIDGGSTDGSAELAAAQGVRVLREPKVGLTGRMNIGYRSAKGELIGSLGADDILLPGAVEAVVAAYKRQARRWVIGGVRWISADGQSLGEVRAPPLWMNVAAHVALDWNVISPLATYMNRDFFSQLGGHDERYNVSADFHLYAHALQKEPFERVARPLAAWRRHRRNFSVVHGDLGVHEVHAIRQSLGLSHDPGRPFRRCAMKAWVNLRNPGWCGHKLIERARLQLGMA